MMPSPHLASQKPKESLRHPPFQSGELRYLKKIGLVKFGFDENHAENEAPNLNPDLVHLSLCSQGSESYQEWILVK